MKGEITKEDRDELIACCAHKDGGGCGGMYTANTMSMACEVLGFTLPNSSSNPANSPEKIEECLMAESVILNMLRNDITPDKIMTKTSLENAIKVMLIVGGSTNGILHLLAIAKEANIELNLEEFEKFSRVTPILGNFLPSGDFTMEDLYKAGGTARLMKYLLDKGVVDGSTNTITGKTMAENYENYKPISTDKTLFYPLESPLKKDGNFKILKGNLSTGGCVAKISSKEANYFKGPAKVYTDENLMLTDLENNSDFI